VRALDVSLNGKKVGRLTEGDDLWQFDYEPAWMESPDGFDISPGLPRAEARHRDGGTQRPVQWYFDNLLPEETLRETVAREARIQGDDAFALLEYLGAESAGSLVLLPPGQAPSAAGGLRPLEDATLGQRIRDLPRTTLASGASKRMSAAGAQHKLLVVVRDGQLFEPVGGEPSTHILKPDHPGDDYPASVINETFAMRLASAVLGDTPEVSRRYLPEPVYIVRRFDRYTDVAGATQRRHIVDACQLLNKPRGFKYRAASVQALADIVVCCRNRARTRLRLFGWLVFNLLIGNDDNHLKNLSFMVGREGIELAPWYDLLSTATYRTRAMADHRADWPEVDLMIPLPGASRFGAVTRESVLAAGRMLGLPLRLAMRELDRIGGDMAKAAPALVEVMVAEGLAAAGEGNPWLAGESRLMRTIQHLVLPEMLGRVGLKSVVL
jgi:serine/threonine-protein kinase HipA